MFGFPGGVIAKFIGGGGGGPYSPTVGRANTIGAVVTPSPKSVSFASGGAPVNGSWLFGCTAWESPPSVGTAAISGGATWTEIASGTLNLQHFKHLCGGSEPSSYSVTFPDDGTNETGCVAVIFEVLTANPTNPVDTQSNTLTATPPPATATGAGLSILLLSALNYASITVPIGYTLAASNVNANSHLNNTIATAVAYKSITAGIIVPGAWTINVGATVKNTHLIVQ